ncbi:MAG TPA: DUF2306 domain-containing protein [Puia sp.]
MSKTQTLNKVRRLLHILMFLPAIIGIAVVVRRTLVLAGLLGSFNPPGMAGTGGMAKNAPAFDDGFGRHPIITLIHILPGALFMILGPLQFIPGIRRRYRWFHRLSGRIYIIAAYIIGLSALYMPFVIRPIGGLNEAAATTLFAILFLVSLSKAWWYIVHKQVAPHREWMIRAFSIGLAVGTIRPIVALFFVFSGLPPQTFFGTAFWIGFTLQLLAAEIWINYTRGSL